MGHSPGNALPSDEARRWMRPVAMAAALSMGLSPLAVHAQAPNAPSTQAASTGDTDSVWLNMPNTDLEAVVRAIGQYTGRAFVIDPRVKGTLTLVTEHAVTKRQAYELLLSALRLQGFTVVESGNVARILPEADAKLQGSRVIAPPAQAPRGDQVVTQVFRLQYESVTNLVPILRPLIPPNNTISAYPANNSLVITDYADNLRRIQDIISVLDTSLGAEPEIIALKHGLAVEIGTIANRILDEGARAAGQATDAGQRVQVLAEPRTNSLIVRAASPARLDLAKKIIDQLDQPSTTPGNINVVYLRNAEATKLAPLLRAIVAGDPSYVPSTDSSGGLSAASGLSGQGGAGSSGQTISATGSGGGGGNQALGGLIQADASTNSLIITAPPPLYRSLRTTIEKLDVRRAQVMIETLIVEVSTDKAAELGVQFQALGGLRSGEGNNTHVIGGTNFGGGGQNIIGAAQNLGGLGGGLNVGVIRGTITIPGIGEVTNLGFLARALESSASANVLSRPNIQVLDNEEAKFLVGQNVPFITGSFTQGQSSGATNPFQTFERRDVGLQLRVKPQVSEGGAVKLAIYVEISSVQPGSASGQLITNKRSFESSVIVEDGNFVVLSGLIEDKGNDGVSKVPLLGDIPVLGALFRYENRSRTKTNTMVFLKPNVIRDEQASSSLAADRYDFIRQKLATTGQRNSLIFRHYESDGLPPLPPPSPSPAPTPEPAAPIQTAPSNKESDGTGPSSSAADPTATVAVLTAQGLQTPAEPTTEPAPAALVKAATTLSYAPPQPLAPPKPAALARPVDISLPEPSAPPAPEPVAPPANTTTAPEPLPPGPVAMDATPKAPKASNAAPPAEPAIPSPTPAAPVDPAALQPTKHAASKPTPASSAAQTPVTSTPAQATAAQTPATLAAPKASAEQRASTPPQSVEAPSAKASAPVVAMAAAPPSAAPAKDGPQLIQVANVPSIVKGRQLQRQLGAAGLDAYWESVRERSPEAPDQPPKDVVRVRVWADGAAQNIAEVLATLKQLGFEPVLVQP